MACKRSAVRFRLAPPFPELFQSFCKVQQCGKCRCAHWYATVGHKRCHGGLARLYRLFANADSVFWFIGRCLRRVYEGLCSIYLVGQRSSPTGISANDPSLPFVAIKICPVLSVQRCLIPASPPAFVQALSSCFKLSKR